MGKSEKECLFSILFRGKNKQQQFLLNQKKNIYWFSLLSLLSCMIISRHQLLVTQTEPETSFPQQRKKLSLL